MLIQTKLLQFTYYVNFNFSTCPLAFKIDILGIDISLNNETKSTFCYIVLPIYHAESNELLGPSSFFL